MSYDVEMWLSAGELALLGGRSVAGLPGTLSGCIRRAKNEGWVSRQEPCMGGKGGMRAEYQLPFDMYVQVKAFLDMNPDFFKKKRGARVDRPSAPVPVARESAVVYLGDDGSVLIDRYVDVRGSAGPGAVVHEEAIVKVRVDAKLLRERVGRNFSHIKMAGVSGDSMEPTLSHGDQVLVDTSCNRFVDDAIYAIQQDGHLRFKRIKLKMDGSIIVKSDSSPDVETYTAEEAAGFFVVGIVIPFKFGRFKV